MDRLLLPSRDFFANYFPQGLKILLVGTDDTVGAIIQRQLPYPYYRITNFPTAASALEFLELGLFQFHLVISDVSLPDMDGFLFIRQQLSLTYIPHVAICGSSEIPTAFRSGASYVLSKPSITEGAADLRNLWQHVLRSWYPEELVNRNHDD